MVIKICYAVGIGHIGYQMGQMADWHTLVMAVNINFVELMYTVLIVAAGVVAVVVEWLIAMMV